MSVSGRKDISSEKKRPVVAFINGDVYDEHSRWLLSEFTERFRKDEFDFHCFMGADFNCYLGIGVTANLLADYHYYSLYSYLAYDDPDLIILTMGGLTNAEDSTSVEEFIAHLPKVPVILLENDTELPGVTHILIDNYRGIYSVVEHLIRDHGYRRIAHLAGPRKNNDSCIREKAFRDALKANDIPVREEWILHGDYTRNVDWQAEALLDAGVEAIVSANDVMAEKCYQRAGLRGLRIGEDIAITGFDDIPTAAFMEPPLTTVCQPHRLIADETAVQVHRFFAGEQLTDIRIPAEFMRRASCGCHAEKGVKQKRTAGEHFMEGRARFEKAMLQSMECAVALRNLLCQEVDAEGFFREVGETLHHLGAKRAFLLLHEEPLIREKKEVLPAPDEIRLVMIQEGENIKSYGPEQAPVIRKGELRRHLNIEERTVFSDFVLFYQKYEYGVLSVEISPEEILFFYSLSLEIGSGLRYWQISSDRQSFSETLKERNQILEYTASHDNLTGIYNRAGLMDALFRYVHSYPSGDQFALIMADLDHLKQINDTFGHNEGDVAIRQVADALRFALPKGSPIGRNGGDEFMGVIRINNPDQLEEALGKIRSSCEDFNNTAKKPYYVNVSIGYQKFDSEDLKNLLQIIERADQELYIAKTKRRKSVVR